MKVRKFYHFLWTIKADMPRYYRDKYPRLSKEFDFFSSKKGKKNINLIKCLNVNNLSMLYSFETKLANDEK